MNRLALALYTRYQLQGDKMDSTRAKAYLQQALELCPSGHPTRLSILRSHFGQRPTEFTSLVVPDRRVYITPNTYCSPMSQGGAWTVGHLHLVVHAYAFRPHSEPDQASASQGIPSFVSIGQPNAAGYSPLESVRQELDKVHQLLPESVQFTGLIDEAATREAVLTALRTHTFAHLACHGQQVAEWPYDSHFAMHDGRLTLLDFVHSQVSHETEFAFLSACKTVTGDVDVPDEVIHLAAALQFAGVGNVVGTMWSVDDQVVVYTVEAFYRAMVREDGVFDSSRAARALRAATRATKDRVPLDQRIVFIHIGG